MAIDRQVYLGQTFLKVIPTDRSLLIETSKKASIELAKKYNELKAKENLTKKEKKELITIMNDLREVSVAANLDRFDYMGMDHFWTLTSDNTAFNLFTIPIMERDIMLQYRFNSIDKIFGEYRSLDDIVENEPIVGKKLHAQNDMEAYILYELENLLIGIGLNEEGIPIGPLLARKYGVKDIAYIDESIPELDDPQILYEYVKILKNRG